jgi:hypothetical protein
MLTLRQKYFETFKANLDRAVEVTRRKNEGYTAGSDDNYSNFRFASLMSSLPGKEPVTVAQTLLSRMADKISRYKSLTVKPDAAHDESMEDTLHDLMVYANILLTWEQLGRPAPDALFENEEELPDPYPEMTEEFNDPIVTPGSTTSKIAALFNWKAPAVTK